MQLQVPGLGVFGFQTGAPSSQWEKTDGAFGVYIPCSCIDLYKCVKYIYVCVIHIYLYIHINTD